MEYKSSRSEKFRDWTKELDREKREKLTELEKYARLVVHYFKLTGDFRNEDMQGLIKAVEMVQAEYENTGS